MTAPGSATADSATPRILVVGGGAGGLELATRLGNKLGRSGKARITLIDSHRTHIWKPLLHQIAAGASDPSEHALEYLAQARWHGFRFRLGRMDGLDRERRLVWLAPVLDDDGREIIGRRSFAYDRLVLAIGSEGNDFGIEGVGEHCMMLDDKEQAVEFQSRLLNIMLNANTQHQPMADGQLDIAIVGAGATGVELAAQLHRVSRLITEYGLEEIDPDLHMRINLLEAGPRILPALPEKLTVDVTRELESLQVRVLTGTAVSRVTADGVYAGESDFIPAAIKVWTAGVKAPAFLADLDLETNRINQVRVGPDLRSLTDENIFAIGDCAECPTDDDGGKVPPRAQAAHQQATHLARTLIREVRGRRDTRHFVYRDYGALVTLGRYSTIGSLMGSITGSVKITGYVARLVYLSLYKSHQLALHGLWRTILLTLAFLLRRTVDPPIKLH